MKIQISIPKLDTDSQRQGFVEEVLWWARAAEIPITFYMFSSELSEMFTPAPVRRLAVFVIDEKMFPIFVLKWGAEKLVLG